MPVWLRICLSNSNTMLNRYILYLGLVASLPVVTSAVSSPLHILIPAFADSTKKCDPYDSLNLGKLGLSRTGFDYAMIGYKKLRVAGLLGNDNILTIIDFSRTSDKKRMFVIDVKKCRLLFNTYAAHGRNSGKEEAIYFSNEPESFKSSVGFYVTAGTYSGAHGFSLRLAGYEKGYNDNALERDIVVHSAEYVSEALIKQQGFIGRSLGCPAVSPALNKALINAIKDKTCLFVFGKESNYISDSKLLKQPVKKRSRFLPPL